jgi:hypothetical protein
MNLRDIPPPAVRPRVTEACAPYDTAVVNTYAIAERLSLRTLQDMAVMLAIVHPRHFETAVLRDGARP